jgi:hypothetical protein
MDGTQKTDSGFQLNVSADSTQLNTGLNNDINVPSSIVVGLPDTALPQQHSFEFNNNTQLPQSSVYKPQPSLQLPESLIFQPTPEKIQPHVQPYQSTLGDTHVNVKVNAEDALKKATEVGNHLNSVKKDLESLSAQMRNPDQRTSSQNNFDERVTIPAQNVIFDNRKNKMSRYPDWV